MVPASSRLYHNIVLEACTLAVKVLICSIRRAIQSGLLPEVFGKPVNEGIMSPEKLKRFSPRCLLA